THKVDTLSLHDALPIFGCGGVGAAAIAGSALAGADTIIAVDIDDRKLEGARAMGATHTVNSKDADPVAAIQGLTGGNGADVVIRSEEHTSELQSRSELV